MPRPCPGATCCPPTGGACAPFPLPAGPLSISLSQVQGGVASGPVTGTLAYYPDTAVTARDLKMATFEPMTPHWGGCLDCTNCGLSDKVLVHLYCREGSVHLTLRNEPVFSIAGPGEGCNPGETNYLSYYDWHCAGTVGRCAACWRWLGDVPGHFTVNSTSPLDVDFNPQFGACGASWSYFGTLTAA